MSTPASPITNITAASAATALLPAGKEVQLPDGVKVRVARLSWLQFEAVWSELSGLLAGVAAAPDSADPQQLAHALSGAPAFVLNLCALTTPLGESELSGPAL